MSQRFFWTAAGVGLAAIAWVAAGFAGTNWIAFAMTLVIAATFLAGANELRRLRQDTAALAAALAADAPPATLGEWLAHVPAALRSAVRHRVEDGRGGLPGPQLTPYLVGLLVMFGMLGTFVGMVVTFKGAMFALEGSTDLAAMRAALAEPIRGLGLSFGTSVAGVAASAMLGLMSAIARRERLEVQRQLDLAAAGGLRAFSLAHQREQALVAAQAQAAALPTVLDRLDAMMARMEARSVQLDERLQASQAQFHEHAARAYTQLAGEVGESLRHSLAAGAQAAGDSIRPVMEGAVSRIVNETERLHARLADAAQAQADALAAQYAAAGADAAQRWQAGFEQQAGQQDARLAAWTTQLQALADGLAARWDSESQRTQGQVERTLEQIAQLVEQSESLVRARTEGESRWLAEQGERMDGLTGVWRTQLEALRDEESRRGAAAVDRLAELQAAVAQHLASLGAALEAPLARLLATASEVPQAAAGVLAQLRAEMGRLAERENASLEERTVLVERLGALVATVEEASRHASDMATHANANAIELSSWGEAFGGGVAQFHATSERLVAAMQQVEGAVSRATARSDEQLAYYVAQAREVIDLSIASQHGVLERLRELAGQPVGFGAAAAKS